MDEDVAKMTLDELQAEFVTLGDQLSIVANRRQTVLAAITKKQADAMVSARVSRMSAEEKDALRAALEGEQ
jgi:hypothetical protein